MKAYPVIHDAMRIVGPILPLTRSIFSLCRDLYFHRKCREPLMLGLTSKNKEYFILKKVKKIKVIGMGRVQI